MVLVVDGLGAGCLGPYGNSWIDTPHINQFASQSLLCENAISDSPDLAMCYRAYWRGTHVAEATYRKSSHLAFDLAEQGIETVLVMEEGSLPDRSSVDEFTRLSETPAQDVQRAVADVNETGMAMFFSEAVKQLTRVTPPFLLWIHCRGMTAPWDAPYEVRASFPVEDDPLAPRFVEVPSLTLPSDYDPDQLLGIVHAHAGQVALLDTCLGGFLAGMKSLEEIPLMTILTSPRGFPLGEHGSVGICTNELYNELLHVPLILRFSDGTASMNRTHGLVQPVDVHATIYDWFRLDRPPSVRLGASLGALSQTWSKHIPDRAYARWNNEHMFRTAAWMLKFAQNTNQCELSDLQSCDVELYAKPDDRFEVNNVAVRCSEIVDEMQLAMNEFLSIAEADGECAFGPLPEILVQHFD